MNAIFITILNMSITASVVALAVMLARIPLKKAPKIFSYALWGVVLFRLVCPFSIESGFSFLPTSTIAIPQDIVYSQNPAVHTGIGFVDAPVNAAINNTLSPVVPENIANPIHTVFNIAGYIWLFGFAVLLVYAIIGYIRLKRRVYYATLVRDNIFETDAIKTPFVLGFIRPKIYIPLGIDPAQQDYILKHEQTHIKRRDYLIKPFAFIVFALHWFNPLMWVSYFLMSKDIEMSCDETVLRKEDEDIRGDYSSSLLNLSVKRGSILLTPLAFGESNVKGRVKNVLNFKKPSRVIIIVAVMLVVVLSAGFALNRVGEAVNYLNDRWFGNFDGKEMTLDDVRELAAKGDDLLFADLQEYKGINASSSFDRYIMVYGVEGGYRLVVNHHNTQVKPNSVYLESIWADGGSGIDIRYGNIDEFLQNNPSQEAITEEQAINILTDWWKTLVDWEQGDPLPNLVSLGTSLEPSGEACWLFVNPGVADVGDYWAVAKRSGIVYVGTNKNDGSEDWNVGFFTAVFANRLADE